MQQLRHSPYGTQTAQIAADRRVPTPAAAPAHPHVHFPAQPAESLRSASPPNYTSEPQCALVCGDRALHARDVRSTPAEQYEGGVPYVSESYDCHVPGRARREPHAALPYAA